MQDAEALLKTASRTPRLLAGLVVGLLLVVPVAAKDGPSVDATFDAPAQLGPQVQAVNATWALILFESESTIDLRLDLHQPAAYTNLTRSTYGNFETPIANGDGYVFDSSPTATLTPGRLHLSAPHHQLGSLYIEGALELQADVLGQAVVKGDTDCVDALLNTNQAAFNYAVRAQDLCPRGPHAVLAFRSANGTADFRLTGTDVDATEWHGLETVCQDVVPCPSGGHRTADQVPLPGGVVVENREYGYSILGTSNGNLEGRGQGALILVGGPAIDVVVDGTIRLPRAETACESCLDPDGRTLQATGLVRLQQLHPVSESRLATALSGDIATARIDETSVNPTLLGLGVASAAAAAVGATLGLAALLRFILGAGWRQKQKDHPRRQELLALIVKQPGINFHGIRRDTGLSSGVLNHHLDALCQRGDIIARHDGNRVRYFENHGTHDKHWPFLALLRDESIRRLYEWMGNAGTISRQAVLSQSEAWGWKPGIARYRISKLVAAGLVASIRTGRTIVYTAQAPTALPGFSQSASNRGRAPIFGTHPVAPSRRVKGAGRTSGLPLAGAARRPRRALLRRAAEAFLHGAAPEGGALAPRRAAPARGLPGVMGRGPVVDHATASRLGR